LTKVVELDSFKIEAQLDDNIPPLNMLVVKMGWMVSKKNHVKNTMYLMDELNLTQSILFPSLLWMLMRYKCLFASYSYINTVKTDYHEVEECSGGKTEGKLDYDPMSSALPVIPTY